MVNFPPMQMSDKNYSPHRAFRDWVYDEMEKEQARLDKYFSDDLDEEGGEDDEEI